MNEDPPVDSREGIRILVKFARGGGLVLNQAHREIAEKHGVSTEGVAFAGPLPAYATAEGGFFS